MHFIDTAKLEDQNYSQFRNAQPFPWANPSEMLFRSAYEELLNDLPDISLFKKSFGAARANGQKSHDRYSLKFEPTLDVPKIWQEFIAELTGPAYIGFLENLFNARSIYLDLFWYYTPPGCSVSPHCDHLQKLGAQIFYLNKEEEWNENWGGETLLLDDDGKFSRRSAPDFGDFKDFISPPASGNQSLIFARTGHSWHGVREITCPDDVLRKIFLVTIKSSSRWEVAKRRYDWW